MPNNTLTTDLISNTALARFTINAPFVNTASRVYQPEFTNTGYKVGDTINVRRQNHFLIGDGAKASPQDIIETVEPIVINHQYHAMITYTSKDLTLNIEDFDQRFITPAVQAIISKMELDISMSAERELYYFTGNAGTPINSFNTVDLAGTKLLEQGVDIAGNAYLVTSLRDANSLKSSLINNFTPAINDDIVRTSSLGHLSYFDVFQSQNVIRHTAGAGAALSDTLQVDGAVSSGNVIVLKGATNSVTNYFLPGDLIEIAGVYSVNPVNRKSTGQKMQFVVTSFANSSGGGAVSITVSPSIISNTNNPLRNVSNAIPNNAVVTFIEDYNVNVAYPSRGLDIACPPLEKLQVPVFSQAYDEETGLSLTLTQAGDISEYQNYMRLDILCGFKWHPQYALKLIS